MANWRYKLELSDLKDKFENDEISIDNLGTEMAKRIRNLKLKPFDSRFQKELDTIANEFETCKDVDNFDSILDRLYDWGDTGNFNEKLCWIGFAF